MTDIDVHPQPRGHTVSGARLCASIVLFMLSNFAGAAVIPLIAMVSA